MSLDFIWEDVGLWWTKARKPARFKIHLEHPRRMGSR